MALKFLSELFINYLHHIQLPTLPRSLSCEYASDYTLCE